MRGRRQLLALAAIDGALFHLSGVTAASVRHSGTLSHVLWIDFLLGVLALIVLVAIAILRPLASSRR